MSIERLVAVAAVALGACIEAPGFQSGAGDGDTVVQDGNGARDVEVVAPPADADADADADAPDPGPPPPTFCDRVGRPGCCADGGGGQVLLYCETDTTIGVSCPGACGWVALDAIYACGGVGAAPEGGPPRGCPEDVCVPSCDQTRCDQSNGCGGTCGCAVGQQCYQGSCNLGPCGPVSEVGCCNSDEFLVYCIDGVLAGSGCDGCGWSAEAGYYSCDGSGSDPSGTHPRLCADLE